MKKSLLIAGLLAAIAGTAGTVIGLVVARARHPAARTSTLDTHAPAPSESKNKGGSLVIHLAKDAAPTPPFLVADLNGTTISTVALKGKVILINFWATWCPPCREEIPELVDLQDKYKDRLQIIGVSMDEDLSPPEVNAFAKKAGINYPVVMGRDIAAEYGGVPALPTSFVVNKDGAVVQKHVGVLQPEEIEAEVRALSGMPVDATIETFTDTGQIFLKNAERATELPGVDMGGLTPEQKAMVLKRMNSETCTCGCKLTLAQCRINDTECPVSEKIAAQIVQEVKSGAEKKAAATPAHPGSSD